MPSLRAISVILSAIAAEGEPDHVGLDRFERADVAGVAEGRDADGVLAVGLRHMDGRGRAGGLRRA